jgi:hypothetical protein
MYNRHCIGGSARGYHGESWKKSRKFHKNGTLYPPFGIPDVLLSGLFVHDPQSVILQ